MLIPDWLLPTFALLPAMLWFFFGAGLPWALAILPRSDWRRWSTVVGVAMALGPLVYTLIMFQISPSTVSHTQCDPRHKPSVCAIPSDESAECEH